MELYLIQIVITPFAVILLGLIFNKPIEANWPF